MNIGYQVMNNLVLPKKEKPDNNTGNGLLARNPVNKTKSKDLSVTDRVASYVAEIRKAREGLQNGRNT